MLKTKDALLVLALLAAAALGAFLWMKGDQVPQLGGSVITGQIAVGGPYALTDQDGKPRASTDFGGKYQLIYFGYTFCPDVCPTTMAYVKKALSSLPSEDRDRVKVVMVTIDPARDTAAKLTDYLKAFVPDGAAVRTDDQTLLRSATGAFGADYKVTTAADGTIEVSHTGEVYVVDDTGTVVLAWPFGTTPKDIHADLARLLAGDRPQST